MNARSDEPFHRRGINYEQSLDRTEIVPYRMQYQRARAAKPVVCPLLAEKTQSVAQRIMFATLDQK